MLTAVNRATGRNVFLMLAVVGLLLAASRGVMVPAYKAAASGFAPFDLQFPLTRAMLAIQRGAFSSSVGAAYLRFAAVDAVLQLALAILLALFWAWIMARAPLPVFERLKDYGLLLFPVFAVVCDLAEEVVFAMLTLADRHLPLYQLTTVALAIHHVRFLFMDADLAISITLVAFVVYERWHGTSRKRAL